MKPARFGSGQLRAASGLRSQLSPTGCATTPAGFAGLVDTPLFVFAGAATLWVLWRQPRDSAKTDVPSSIRHFPGAWLARLRAAWERSDRQIRRYREAIPVVEVEGAEVARYHVDAHVLEAALRSDGETFVRSL